MKMLPPAVYQYKFIVDGEWKYAPDQVRERERESSIPPLLLDERFERPWHAGLQDTLGDNAWEALPLKQTQACDPRDAALFGCCGLSGTCVARRRRMTRGALCGVAWVGGCVQPAMYDELGNVNNVLEVQEYVPENLESLTGFQAPASPPSSYNQMLPQPDDYAKEPPAVPPQLLLTLLNCPNTNEGLPRPQHVILNHLYTKRSKAMTCSGITHRYRSKYVTVVMYKPERRENK